MKKLVLGIATVGLLVSCGGDDKKKGDEETVIKTEVTSANVGDLTIGYYDMEKLYTEFDFVRENNEKLQSEAEEIQKKLMTWQNIGQNSLNQLESNQALSVDQQLALDQKMQNAQRMIQQIQQTDAYEIQQKQANFTMTVEKKLVQYSKEFAEENGIKMIFARGAGSGLSYIDSTFDITNEFIQYMNAKEKAILGDDPIIEMNDEKDK